MVLQFVVAGNGGLAGEVDALFLEHLVEPGAKHPGRANLVRVSFVSYSSQHALTITPEMTSRQSMTTPNNTAASPGSMPGSLSFALVSASAASSLGSCLGYNVSMNCSICFLSATHHLQIVSFYLGTLDADAQEVGVSRVVLGMYAASILPEDIADCGEILGRLHHDLAGVALGDLDVSLKNCRVPEDSIQSRNGHALGYGNEVENALFLHACHVEEAFLSVLECVHDHL